MTLLKVNNAISKAEANLVSKFGRNKFCTYGLAISVYGLYMTPRSDESGEEMKQELENRIQPSTECE